MTPLVLASRSPQRRAILEQVGIPFVVRPAGVAELERGDPVTVARENALRKARAVAGDPSAAIGPVLGVDTIVVLEGLVIGKPPDAESAHAMLRRLAGRAHTVVSAIALVVPGESPPRSAEEATEVVFRPLAAAALDWYVARGEWRDRAGGYAIQGAGAALVREIRGDYLNVVGLPLAALLALAPELAPDRTTGNAVQ